MLKYPRQIVIESNSYQSNNNKLKTCYRLEVRWASDLIYFTMFQTQNKNGLILLDQSRFIFDLVSVIQISQASLTSHHTFIHT